jgi:hypothetical protein
MKFITNPYLNPMISEDSNSVANLCGRTGRRFVMHGRPLGTNDRYAAFRRLKRSAAIRSNIRVSGTLAASEIPDTDFPVAIAMREIDSSGCIREHRCAVVSG